MKNPKESLCELLLKVEQVEIGSICDKLRAIITFCDLYVPEMGDNPKDEFMIHIADLRAEAIALLAECGKVSGNGNGDQLTRIKEKFLDLKSFVEYLFALRGQEMVEHAHQAL